MIIITNNSGQLCNQLLLFAHCVATGIETGRSVIYLLGRDIAEATELKSGTAKQLKIKALPWKLRNPFSWGWSWLANLLETAQGIKTKNKGHKKLDESKTHVKKHFESTGKKRRWHAINDWYFRNPEAMARNHDKVVELLALKKNFYEKPREIIAGIRRNHPGVEIIGVHIRRRDYKTYNVGRWFYTDEEYLRFMREVASSFFKAPAFLICSDEPINLEFFQRGGMDAFTGPGHKIEDLAALSLCDKIIGPPSTYSWWAAFVSKKPLWHVSHALQPVEFQTFNPFTPTDWP